VPAHWESDKGFVSSKKSGFNRNVIIDEGQDFAGCLADATI
jgi:hypothetical protein